jgi:RimJ/RimL family protein N-acetyltransferase
MVKKRHEKQKEEIKRNQLFSFAIRHRAEDRLLGVARIYWITWSNGTAWLQLAIGAAADRREGYAADALDLLLHYAFAELNLHRLTVRVPAFDEDSVRLLEAAGFTIEVRQREARQIGGRYFDLLFLGMLQPEWLERRQESA